MCATAVEIGIDSDPKVLSHLLSGVRCDFLEVADHIQCVLGQYIRFVREATVSFIMKRDPVPHGSGHM